MSSYVVRGGQILLSMVILTLIASDPSGFSSRADHSPSCS